MKVVCIGSGYVGSVTAATFAAWGHQTTVIDAVSSKIDLINAGNSPIFEPGLETLIKNNIGKSLFATTSYRAVHDADVVFIAVGTPQKSDGTADLQYVKSAADSIAKHLNPNKFTVVVNKSTVPVGTAQLVASVMEATAGVRDGVNFAVVSNPEFLREGYAVKDVFFPDRVVIGTENERAKRIMCELYQRLREESPKTVYFETDTKSAEMIKYTSNAFLAVKISYVNEVARLCEALGANANDVAMGMGLDSRIGGKFLEVSSGWSGSCFPKDTRELLTTSRKYGCELTLVRAAVTSNKRMHQHCIDKIQRKVKGLNGKQIGVLGLTFKPNTDDARETQATYIIGKLLDMGASVKVHDPKGMEIFQALNRGLSVQYCTKAEEVACKADAVVLLTHWDEYRSLDWEWMYQSMRYPYVLDTRNFLNESWLREIGYQYEGLGH